MMGSTRHPMFNIMNRHVSKTLTHIHDWDGIIIMFMLNMGCLVEPIIFIIEHYGIANAIPPPFKRPACQAGRVKAGGGEHNNLIQPVQLFPGKVAQVEFKDYAIPPSNAWLGKPGV